MTVSMRESDDGSVRTISVQGQFDFSLHKVFRDIYRDAPETVKQFIVDLQKTEYMDSSALGMLLLFREYAGSMKASVSIINCNTEVMKILEIANFNKLFDIR